ncbi:MAG: IS630 family transposase [Phycisphaerae bacterium]
MHGATSFHDWREWRRFRAMELHQQGWPETQIAAALGTTPSTVSRWLAAVRRTGPEALRHHPSPGRPPKLSPEQMRLIPDRLWHGPEAYGFRGNVWTCPRVVAIIAQEFGVHYSPSEVSRLLKRLNWTPQVPITRAIQRDEEAIDRWRVEVWPQIRQRAQREHRTLVFVDESGIYLLPGVVKTYAPKARRPVLKTWQARDHLSVMAGLSTDGHILSLVRQTSLTGLHTIEFLLHLLGQIGPRLLIVWDRSPIHRRAEVTDFLADRIARQLRVEWLPPYAPDLNPLEWMWEHIKHVEMRNLACMDLEELHFEFHLALGRVRQKHRLVPGFFKGAGLSLTNT